MADDALAYLSDLTRHGIKLGLHAIGALCEALGHPERAFPSVVVAGTNGKGSVAALVETGLRRSGHRTGLFTSPHLTDLTERFALDGAPVSSTRLVEQIPAFRSAVDSLVRRGRLATAPTFFEATTALAFQLFRDAGVDVGILEVGLGGRFDATNVVTPRAVVVTGIDLDHQQYLGDSLAAIAREKAGVIKPGGLVVTGETKPEALDVLTRRCRDVDAVLVETAREVETTVQLVGSETEVTLTTPRATYGPLELSLRGRHQAVNAAVAVRLLEELGSRGGPPASHDAIVAALTGTRWPGRLELVEVAPGRRVLMDAAHNVAAAGALAAYLREAYPEGLPLVLGVMADKDAAGLAAALVPVASRVLTTTVPGGRALGADALAAVVRRAAPELEVASVPGPRAALEAAWRDAHTTCVAGSIHLLGELRHSVPELDPTHGRPLAPPR